MDKQTGPKGFLVVLPGEIIEIPQDSDKSWLTLFYSLPRELAEKWKPAYELPRCPYAVLRTDKYDHIVCDDMFKLLVWDCYAWCAWQFFQVKDRKGNYRDIPGNWNQYAGYFPLWRLSYSIIPYIRMKFEQKVISEMQIAAFAEQSISEKDREILKLRMDGLTEQEIADKVGYKTASAVHKRIAKIAKAYEDYVTAEYSPFASRCSPPSSLKN